MLRLILKENYALNILSILHLQKRLIFTINACCEAFKSTLIKEAEKAIKIELEKAISQMFKNAFK